MRRDNLNNMTETDVDEEEPVKAISITARVTVQSWDRRDQAQDLGVVDVEVADRLLAMGADAIRALKDAAEAREHLVEGRVEHEGRLHEGPWHVDIELWNVAELIAGTLGLPGSFTINDLTDKHLRRTRRRLRTSLKLVQREMAELERSQRVREVEIALRRTSPREAAQLLRRHRDRARQMRQARRSHEGGAQTAAAPT